MVYAIYDHTGERVFGSGVFFQTREEAEGVQNMAMYDYIVAEVELEKREIFGKEVFCVPKWMP